MCELIYIFHCTDNTHVHVCSYVHVHCTCNGELVIALYITFCSPKRRFSDYMKLVEEVQTAEPKLILKRSPKEVSTLEQVSYTCSVFTCKVHVLHKVLFPMIACVQPPPPPPPPHTLEVQYAQLSHPPLPLLCVWCTSGYASGS